MRVALREASQFHHRGFTGSRVTPCMSIVRLQASRIMYARISSSSCQFVRAPQSLVPFPRSDPIPFSIRYRWGRSTTRSHKRSTLASIPLAGIHLFASPKTTRAFFTMLNTLSFLASTTGMGRQPNAIRGFVTGVNLREPRLKQPPNRRLKLTGRLSEQAFVCAPASWCRKARRLRPPALAPQLKRDPLGGSTHPVLEIPNDPSNSFADYWDRAGPGSPFAAAGPRRQSAADSLRVPARSNGANVRDDGPDDGPDDGGHDGRDAPRHGQARECGSARNVHKELLRCADSEGVHEGAGAADCHRDRDAANAQCGQVGESWCLTSAGAGGR